ncbi:FAD-binding oxidoreductase [Luteococcus sp. OSA5]|uniref:FAD-binding oxidoreductase n=1 Tax=Luteococcus sp. OSA5 TaxID=3401630 RepID=UPI003B432B8D
MSCQVRMVTTDGDERVVNAEPGQSVVEAAKQADIILPSLCGKGTCGTCVAQVTSGEYHLRPFEDDALGASAPEGSALMCCAEPTSDLDVALPFDSSRLIEQAPAQREAEITSIERLTPHIVKLTMTLAEDELTGSAAEFEAGQYMQVRVPGRSELRAYSMSNVSNWDGTLEFLIHIREGGLFSTYLDTQAREGDVLELEGPQGTFGLEENGMRPRWFVGGGCGLAPLLSMLRRMAEWGDPQEARLVLGVNTAEDLFGAEEIGELLDQLPELSVTVAVWHPEGDVTAQDERFNYVEGSAVDVLRAGLGEIDDEEEIPDIYVCGPPGMVTALEEATTAAGVPAERVHTERISAN